MLDKFKLFNGREKEGSCKPGVGASKRTSSSSGFSSARSEHSDSSTSLSSDARHSGIITHERVEAVIPAPTSSVTAPSSADPNSPRFRGLRPKLAKSTEKKTGLPRLRRSSDIKTEKVRGIADGERKDVGGVEEQQRQSKAVMETPTFPRPPSSSLLDDRTKVPSPAPALSPGSSIPKPMAAVKGTSKLLPPPEHPSPYKGNCPSMPQLPNSDVKRDIALVSPMRSSVNEADVIRNNEQDEKKGKEEDGEMEVKPMSPLLNGYRLGGHLTHPGYINNNPKVYYSQYKDPRIISLNSIDLAGYLSDGDLLRKMNQSNLAMNHCDGYISESGVGLMDRKGGQNNPHQKGPSVRPVGGKDIILDRQQHQVTDLSGDEYHQRKVIIFLDVIIALYPLSDAQYPHKNIILPLIYVSDVFSFILNILILLAIKFRGQGSSKGLRFLLSVCHICKIILFSVSAVIEPEGYAFFWFLGGLNFFGMQCYMYEMYLDVPELGIFDDDERMPLHNLAAPDIIRVVRGVDALAAVERGGGPVVAAQAGPAGPLPDIVPGARWGYGGNNGVNNQEQGAPRRYH